jgi:hypothetical protein
MSNIQAPAVPNLPLPQEQFSKLYLNQLTNVLRLYFNQEVSVLSALVSQLPSNLVYTVSTLPSASASGNGYRAFVTDATATTFASTVAGGGANKVPVYSDGTNWKVG